MIKELWNMLMGIFGLDHLWTLVQAIFDGNVADIFK